MRRRGDRVTTSNSRYAGYRGMIESNVFKRTADYPDKFANGYHMMLDTGVPVTVRLDQVEARVGQGETGRGHSMKG